jgi:hypothetical protein
MKLVPGARRAWRWFSMQALAFQGALAGAWLAVPDDMRAAVPADWLAAAAVVLAVMGAFGRLIDQGGPDAG